MNVRAGPGSEGGQEVPPVPEGSTGKTNAPRKKEKKEKAPGYKREKRYMFFWSSVSSKPSRRSGIHAGQTVPVTAITKAAGARGKP